MNKVFINKLINNLLTASTCLFISQVSMANGGAKVPPVEPESSTHHLFCSGGFCVDTESTLKVVKGGCVENFSGSPATIEIVQAIDPVTGEILEDNGSISLRGPASNEDGQPLFIYSQTVANSSPCYTN